MSPASRSLALSAVLLSAALPIGAQESSRHTLSGSDIAVYNLAGSVRAVAGSGSDVVVTVQRRGADAAKLRVESGAIRGRQTLRVLYPDDRILFRGDGNGSWNTTVDVDDDGTFYGRSDDRDGRRVRISNRGSGTEAFADVSVAVPPGKTISLYLAAGQVEVTNVDGDILVDVGAADVTTSGTKGALRLDTGSGEVRVTNAQGSLDLDSGSGESTLSGVRGPRLNIDSGSGSVVARDVTVDELRVDAGSGDVRLERVSSPEIRLDLGSGSTDLALTTDVRRLEVDSGSGSVTIRVPESLGATLEVDAGSGGLDLQVPVTTRRISRDAFSGSIGDGDGRITIDAGSGRVRILRG